MDDSGLSGISAPPSPMSFSSPAANASQNPPPEAAASPGGLLDMSQPAFDTSKNTSGNGDPTARVSPPQAAICPRPITPPSCGGPPGVPQTAGTPPVLACTPQQAQIQQQQGGDIIRGRAPPSPTIPYTRYVPNYPSQSSPLPQPGTGTMGMRDLIISGEERARQGLTEEERELLRPGLSPVSPGPPYNQFNFLERPCMMAYTEQPQTGPRGTPPFFRLITQPPDGSLNIPPYSPSPHFKIPFYNQSPNTPIPYQPSPGTPDQGQQTTPTVNTLDRTIYDPSNRIAIESPMREPSACVPICPTCSRPVGHSYYAPNMSAGCYSYSGQVGQVAAAGNITGGQGPDGLLSMTQPSFQESCNQSQTSAGQRTSGTPGIISQIAGSQQKDQTSNAGRGSDPNQGALGVSDAVQEKTQNSTSDSINITIPNASQVVEQVGNQWDSSIDASPGTSIVSQKPPSEASPTIQYFASPVPPPNSDVTSLSDGSDPPARTSPTGIIPTLAPETRLLHPASEIAPPRSSAVVRTRTSTPTTTGLHIDAASGLSDSDDRGLQILQTKERRSSLSAKEVAEIEAYLNSHILTEEQIENVRKMLMARGCNLYARGRSSLGEGQVVVANANNKQQSPKPASPHITPPESIVYENTVEGSSSPVPSTFEPQPSPAAIRVGSPQGSRPESALAHGGTQLSPPPSLNLDSTAKNSPENGPVTVSKESAGGIISSPAKGSDVSQQISGSAPLNSSNRALSESAVGAQPLQNGSPPRNANDSSSFFFSPKNSGKTCTPQIEKGQPENRTDVPQIPEPLRRTTPGGSASINSSDRALTEPAVGAQPLQNDSSPLRSANDTSSFFFSPQNSEKNDLPQNETGQPGNQANVPQNPESMRNTTPTGSREGYPAQSTPVQNIKLESDILLDENGRPIPPVSKPEPYTDNSRIEAPQYTRYFASPEDSRRPTQDGPERRITPNADCPITATPNEPVLQDFLYRSLTSVIQDLINDGKWPWKFCNCPCPENPNGENGTPQAKKS